MLKTGRGLSKIILVIIQHFSMMYLQNVSNYVSADKDLFFSVTFKTYNRNFRHHNTLIILPNSVPHLENVRVYKPDPNFIENSTPKQNHQNEKVKINFSYFCFVYYNNCNGYSRQRRKKRRRERRKFGKNILDTKNVTRYNHSD